MSEREPERYEFDESPRYLFDVERREFLRIFAVTGAGLLVVSKLPAAQESGRGGQGRAADGDVSAWVHVGEEGTVTVYTGKAEIGQNIRTSLAQTVADELRVPLSSVAMIMADTDLTPWDAGTFGSRSTPQMAPQLARAAATARQMLIARAAGRWKADPAGLTARDGRVIAGDGRSIAYGELTKGQKLTGAVPAEALVDPSARWTIRGTSPRKVNGREFVTGAHRFTTDLARPGMLHGAIVRPPSQAAALVSVDDRGARSMQGVTVVRDGEAPRGGLVGVVAATERAARQAAAAIRCEWKTPAGLPSSATIYEHLRRTSGGEPSGRNGGSSHSTGDVARARAAAARTIEASYRIPYIAHVPLEPRAAVAEWTDGKLTVWTGTQRPFGVRSELMEAFHLPEERVRVIVPDTGSAYGGKHTGEAAIEAARLAKAAGRPVRLVYSRSEEFAWGYLRPAGVIDVAASLDGAGRITSWEFDNYNSGAAAIQTPYRVPNQRIEFHASDSPFRQGSYRGLAANANNYAREMHMDALARQLRTDPVAFRLDHLDDERLRAVLSAAAERGGWGRRPGADRALGIACGSEKGSVVATVAELRRTKEGFDVERVVVAFECGAIVNPEGVRNQVEGMVVQALGGALFEAVRFADGRLQNGSMQAYRVPRFKDVPAIDVVLLDRRDLPSAGAGETPMIAVAPSIGSAARAFGEVDAALPVALKA
jgi:isoquinoline 1-oxidoreductase